MRLAVFAAEPNLPSGSKVIDMSSGHSTITGRIHCNSDIDVSGTANVFRNGVVEYVTGIHPEPDFQGKVTLQDCPVVVGAVEGVPVDYRLCDFAPGGTEAQAAQAAGKYFHIRGDTQLTAFLQKGELREGLYFVEGKIKIGKGGLHGRVTLVATKEITISGCGENWEPFTRCLLAFSARSLPYDNHAINISGGSSVWTGVLFAPDGGVQISGKENTVPGGALIGRGVKLSGGNLNLTGIDFTTCGGVPRNQPPAVSAGPDQALALHSAPVTIVLEGTVADDGLPTGGTLHSTWSEVSGPGAVVFADATSPSTTATFTTAGTYVLMLTADDSELTNSDTVTITLDRANSPPVAFAQSVTNMEDMAIDIVLEGMDPDGDSLTFSIVRQPEFGTLSGSAPNLRYTPRPDDNGYDSFDFIVNDGFLNSAVATVTITNVPVNDPPLADDQILTAFEDTPLPITLTASDVDGDPLTFSIITGPTNGTLSGTVSDYTYVPAPNFSGVDYFTFVANDGTLDSAPASISITVTPVDDAPLVDAGPDQLINWPDNTVQLAGSVIYDAYPGTVETVEWSQVSGPGTATFGDAHNQEATVTFNMPGRYELQLRASDSFLSGSDSVVVFVNAPPQIDAGPDHLAPLMIWVLLGRTVSDDEMPPGNVLSVTWEQVGGPDGAILIDENMPSARVLPVIPGTYVFRLTVSDGVFTVSDEVTVTAVEILPPEANHPAVVDIGPPQIVPVNELTVTGVIEDDGLPAGQTLTYIWGVFGAGMIYISGADTLTPTITFPGPGRYTVLLTADDGEFESQGFVDVLVEDPASGYVPPVVEAGPDQVLSSTPFEAQLNGQASSSPPEALTFRWQQVSGPGYVSFSPDEYEPGVTARFSRTGTYRLRLLADDGYFVGSDEITIQVNDGP